MSVSVFRFHPLDPHGRLSSEDGETLEKLVREHNESSIEPDSFSLAIFDAPQFLDCGKRPESISCPDCSVAFDHTEWHAVMDADALGDGGFRLNATLQCACGQAFTLDDLTYHPPCAFASSWLSVRVHSHFFTGWLHSLPTLGFIESPC